VDVAILCSQKLVLESTMMRGSTVMLRRPADEQLFHVTKSAVLTHNHELIPPTIPAFSKSTEEDAKWIRRRNGSTVSQTFESTSHDSHSPIPHLDAIAGPLLAPQIS
jgi:hypothetical protein